MGYKSLYAKNISLPQQTKIVAACLRVASLEKPVNSDLLAKNTFPQ